MGTRRIVVTAALLLTGLLLAWDAWAQPPARAPRACRPAGPPLTPTEPVQMNTVLWGTQSVPAGDFALFRTVKLDKEVFECPGNPILGTPATIVDVQLFTEISNVVQVTPLSVSVFVPDFEVNTCVKEPASASLLSCDVSTPPLILSGPPTFSGCTPLAPPSQPNPMTTAAAFSGNPDHAITKTIAAQKELFSCGSATFNGRVFANVIVDLETFTEIVSLNVHGVAKNVKESFETVCVKRPSDATVLGCFFGRVSSLVFPGG